jgi:hypothetical protein
MSRVIAAFVMLAASLAGAAPNVCLENKSLAACFDSSTGFLVRLVNRLSGETVAIREQGFRIEAVEFSVSPENSRLQSCGKIRPDRMRCVYVSGPRTVTQTYTLRNHFLEKTLTVRSPSAFGWKSVVPAIYDLRDAKLDVVRYPNQRMVTYFGRTRKGGIFLGLEKDFDSSAVKNGVLSMGYPVSLKVSANQALETEPVYLGVYRLARGDEARAGLPLQSESDAMVAMTSALLGPPRHGFVPMACGWWSEMEHYTYKDQAAVEADLRSIDFFRETGIDWLSDNHPWGGETGTMNALKETDDYKPGPLVSIKYAYAKKAGLKIVYWPTMNHTHPWWKAGQPFLLHKTEWLMFPKKQPREGVMLSGVPFKGSVYGNCIANRPFLNWINRLSLDGMATGYFPGWAMDGDFFGGGGFVTPVDCPSADHDHLPGEATYACERALTELIANVRKSHPNTFVFVCRPPMDMGVFYQKNIDAVFTIDEMGTPEALPGLSGQPVNVMLGDKVRRWSRVRVHHHFFPHYIDQPQVFVGPKSMGKKYPDWPSEAIDYLMLSALSSSPNQLYYLPTKAGIPARDKQTIRKWLDWGRENVKYLMVRKDLPAWPGVGKVDGNAHIVGDRGLIFLFNPNAGSLTGTFRLDSQTLDLKNRGRYEIAQAYPPASGKRQFRFGEEVKWDVPARGAVVLEIARAAK